MNFLVPEITLDIPFLIQNLKLNKTMNKSQEIELKFFLFVICA
jgi:hypothetical protein